MTSMPYKSIVKQPKCVKKYSTPLIKATDIQFHHISEVAQCRMMDRVDYSKMPDLIAQMPASTASAVL